jgi:hypothetical protein
VQRERRYDAQRQHSWCNVSRAPCIWSSIAIDCKEATPWTPLKQICEMRCHATVTNCPNAIFVDSCGWQRDRARTWRMGIMEYCLNSPQHDPGVYVVESPQTEACQFILVLPCCKSGVCALGALTASAMLRSHACGNKSHRDAQNVFPRRSSS